MLLRFLRIAILGESNSLMEPKSYFLDDRKSRSLLSIPPYLLSLAFAAFSLLRYLPACLD